MTRNKLFAAATAATLLTAPMALAQMDQSVESLNAELASYGIQIAEGTEVPPTVDAQIRDILGGDEPRNEQERQIELILQQEGIPMERMDDTGSLLEGTTDAVAVPDLPQSGQSLAVQLYGYGFEIDERALTPTAETQIRAALNSDESRNEKERQIEQILTDAGLVVAE